MQIGIVGKPSSGKSTFFSAATLIDVAMANYPFTTIEPNKGMGFVRVDDAGKFFGVVSNPRTGFLHNGIRYVPVELIDVAGLVPGACQGKGLGNKFLNDLSQADALIHVVDASGSTDAKGNVVAEGSHDPCEDVEFLEREIDMWFLKILENNWIKFYKNPTNEFGKKVTALAQNLSGVKILEKHIEKALRELKIDEKRFDQWTDDDKKNFAIKCRELSKPILIAANKCDLPSSEKNILKMKTKFPDKIFIPCSAASELALRKANEKQILKYYPGDGDFEIIGELNDKQKAGLETIRKDVLQKFGGTGIQDCMDKTIFGLLGYFPVFPAGTKGLVDKEGRTLADCFLMPPKSNAIDFAYFLHTDMGDGFIRAIDVKTRQVIGRDHPLKTGDAIEIIFNKR
jgi:ribosome-binding ATPase